MVRSRMVWRVRPMARKVVARLKKFSTFVGSPSVVEKSSAPVRRGAVDGIVSATCRLGAKRPVPTTRSMEVVESRVQVAGAEQIVAHLPVLLRGQVRRRRGRKQHEQRRTYQGHSLLRPLLRRMDEEQAERSATRH